MHGEVLTNSLGRDEVAEVGAEEDEDKWEGHPHQELQRKAGLYLGVGPLVDCGDTRWAQSRMDGRTLHAPSTPPFATQVIVLGASSH